MNSARTAKGRVMGMEFHCTENWHNRGYLPHYDAESKIQFITYRLADSLPRQVRVKLKNQTYESLSEEHKEQRRNLIESTLDKGFGSCVLRNPRCADIIVEAWSYFDKTRYDLIAYTVMPNHVHLIIKTYQAYKVGDLVKSWKAHTAKEIRKLYVKDSQTAEYNSALPNILQSGNAFWQREYWDRFIRNEDHLRKSVDYIFKNPVKAGLCKSIFDWKWSNAAFYFK